MRRVVVGFSGGVTSAWCAGFDVHDWLRATLETVRAALLAIKGEK